MPTLTTTVTSACASGTTTTVTTTEATPDAVAPAAAAAKAEAPSILKDGIAINESHFPKVGVPSGPEGITAEWFNAVFHTRGIIGRNVQVTAIDAKQIGEGRGYANYTFLVKLTFSRPVHKDVPTAVAVKIANATFQKNILEGKTADLWKFFNDIYVTESRYYTDARASFDCACPQLFWTEIEYPEDPTTQFGAYGLMIEYLGDDLKMFELEAGIPKTEMREALTAVSCIHAAAWNDDYFTPCLDGGSNHYILSGIEIGKIFYEFGKGGWPSYMQILTDEFAAELPNLVADADYMFNNMGKWWTTGKTGNMTIGSMDLRSENILWKKNADGTFTCVPIDHQGWNHCAPMRDAAMLLGTSTQTADIESDLMDHFRFYYDALVAAGVDSTTYSWADAQDDIAISMFIPIIFGGAMIEIISTLKDAVAAMDGTEDSYQETKNMAENFDSMAKAIRAKAIVGYRMMEKEMTEAAKWARTLK